MKLTRDQLDIIARERNNLSLRSLAKKLGLSKRDLKKAMEEMDSENMKSDSAVRLIPDFVSHPWFWLLFFFLAAFALRLIYFSELHGDPLFRIPILDGAYYDNWARDILAGTPFTTTAFFVEPGYAWLLAFFYKIFSVSFTPVVFFQFLLSAGSVALAYLTGRRLFGQTAGIVAGFLMLFLRPLLFYDGLLLKTSVEIFLISLILYIATFLRSDLGRERSNLGKYFLLGLLLGLTAIIKANILYSVPFILAAIALKLSFRSFLKLSFSFLLGVIIFILPVTIRNWQASHSFVPINYSGGPNIYIGNWYGSDGSLKTPEFISMSPDSEETSWNKMTKAYLGENITPAQISSYWIKRSLEEAKNNVGFFLKNTGKKILLLFHSLPLDDNYSVEYALARFRVLNFTLPFWIVAYFGIFGAVLKLNFRKFRKLSFRILFLYALTFGYALTLVAAHVAERYRLALAPMLVLFAGYFASWLIEKYRSENYGKFWLAIFLSLVALPLPFARLGQISRTMPADTWNNLGAEALEEGRAGEAAGYFESSIAADFRLPMPYNNLGKIFLEEGKVDEAIAQLRKSLQFQPDGSTELLRVALEAKKKDTPLDEIKEQIDELKNKKPAELFDPDYIEAMKLLREQNYKEALPLLEKSLEKFPDNDQILSNLGMACKNTDDFVKAKENLARAILANGYNLPARYNMVNVQRKKKENDLALTQLTIINSMVPGYMLTQLQLAELQLAKGNAAAAKALYQQFLDDKENAAQYPDRIPQAEEALRKLGSQNLRTNP